MKAINIFATLFVFFLSGCATIQVAEVVTKTSIKVAEEVKKNTTENTSDKGTPTKKEKEIVIAKEKEKKVSKKQKNITKINIMNRTLDDLKNEFGEPILTRLDGNTKTIRFDTNKCRLFIYFDKNIKKPKAKYYEIRDTNGNLIGNKEKINECFKEIKKV